MKKILLAIAGLTLTLSAANAQIYPTRPIKLVVPAAAGGAIDILARGVGQTLGEQLGQSIVIENRGGASGIVGTDFVAKSAPDGYTIGLIPDPAFTIYPHVYEKLPFTVEDFAPISGGATTVLALLAHKSVPANSLQELIALAKEKPDSLSFGTPGTGTPMHLAGELIKQRADIKIVHVPYKGGAPAMNDAVAGQIPLLIAGLAPVLPFVESGSLKAIAVTGAQRSALAPQIPTVAESGLPGFQVTTWFGFFAPKDTPPDVVTRLNAEISKALGAPEMGARLQKLGLDTSPSTPAALAERITVDSRTWQSVISKINLRLDRVP